MEAQAADVNHRRQWVKSESVAGEEDFFFYYYYEGLKMILK